MIETRIPQYTFAAMGDDMEQELRNVCKKFAKTMRFDFEYEYYAIYWTEENWTLANLAMPNIDTLLKVH